MVKRLVSKPSEYLPTTHLTEHHLELTGIRHHYRRRSPAMWKISSEVVQETHRAGVIERSASDWCHAPVIQRKSDGSHRFCIDFRDLNLRRMKDAYTEINSLPILHGARYSSTRRSVLNSQQLHAIMVWSYENSAWLAALIAWSGCGQSTEGV